MSSRAENWAWERDDVKGITKFVLVYLARRAYYDDGAAAWPSVKTIAFNCGCCERTVIRSLQELERKGYITRRSVEQDARLKQLVLTEKGRQFHEDTMRAFHQTDEYVAGLLTEEENTELLRLLNKLYLGLK